MRLFVFDIDIGCFCVVHMPFGIKVCKETAHQSVSLLVCHLQAEEFVAEVEKDNFQSVLHRAAQVHPDCTVCLLVDKLEPWLIQQDRKGYQDRIRSDAVGNAGGFRHNLTLTDASCSVHTASALERSSLSSSPVL